MNYRKALDQLCQGALEKFTNSDYISIGQAARDYSEEYGPLFDTKTLMLYDYAMGFFDGDEDSLLEFLEAYYKENINEMDYLLGEG